MYPWIHIHTTPSCRTAPCCIAKSCTDDYALSPLDYDLMGLVNSKGQRDLRLDMLKGEPNPECENCYKHEAQGIESSRQSVNKHYGQFFEEAISYTQEDGGLSEFKMRYFDIRFNNICNFKCRTCQSHYSSQWEQEDLKYKKHGAKVLPKNDNKKLLEDIIKQIPHMYGAYFAGGEPLITEQHYILLEEMIKQGRTDILLLYNTNLSNLKFKDKDLIGLWKHFKPKINLYVSIDHVRERAEYIRHGTDWGVVESNFMEVKKQENINCCINTVLSVFNILTIDKFYEYLVSKNMYHPTCPTYSLYNMSTPTHLSAHILPDELKAKAKISLENGQQLLKDNNFTPEQVLELVNANKWIYSQNTWEKEKYNFITEITRLDRIRGESFIQVFPELAPLVYNIRTNKRQLPVV